MLFAAIHSLVKQEPSVELAHWYASVVGLEAVRDPTRVAPAFVDFCQVHEEEITNLLRTRLVQTNVVKRAAALRFGLSRIALQTRGPVALVELGCSAGALLSQDRYRYRAGRRERGSLDSLVTIDFEWRSGMPLPDLDLVPSVGRRVGIDLYAIDPADPEDRAWMHALVWPENLQEAHLLDLALQVVAADPPWRLDGDARNLVDAAINELPVGMPVVIFHAATRAHVASADRAAFDAAIDRVGETRDLFHLSLEGTAEECFARQYRGSFLLRLEVSAPGRLPKREDLAIVDQHGEWIRPLNGTR